ncbi:MAG: hypothetical protein HUJ99_07800 [Bacteroidaceae bacterium]|nr:hypothetical protein [Bacteroidaceae bacterium]
MPFSYINDVNENLSVYQLTNDVLRAAYAKPNLAIPEICPTLNVNRLHIRQPILGELKVNMGVREYESIGTQTPTASHKDVELLNDRIAVQVSAEAQIENDYGDCISMIAEEQGQALGKALEIWIANALQGRVGPDNIEEAPPLRIVAKAANDDTALASSANLWHHHVVPHAIQLLDDWDPTAVAMHPALWAHLQPMFSGATDPSGSNVPYSWMNNKIPGFDCPVTFSTYLPFNKLYIVSAKATAMRCYQYDTMTPVIDYDPVINADTMYAGIWRTVAAGFRMAKNKPVWDEETGKKEDMVQNGNAGVIEVTLLDGFFGKAGNGGGKREDDKFSTAEYINGMNQDIYNAIKDIAGEYIARQSRLLADAGVRGSEAEKTIKGMKENFTPPKPVKVE